VNQNIVTWMEGAGKYMVINQKMRVVEGRRGTFGLVSTIASFFGGGGGRGEGGSFGVETGRARKLRVVMTQNEGRGPGVVKRQNSPRPSPQARGGLRALHLEGGLVPLGPNPSRGRPAFLAQLALGPRTPKRGGEGRL
jgi:hypothetical protein